MLQILLDDDITEGANSLNSKQRKVFSVLHTWVKDYVTCDGHRVAPFHIFLSCSGGTSKSHLVKLMYNAKSKSLLYHCKGPEKPGFLLLESAGISTVNIGATTIHFCLGIKPAEKLLGLNEKI